MLQPLPICHLISPLRSGLLIIGLILPAMLSSLSMAVIAGTKSSLCSWGNVLELGVWVSGVDRDGVSKDGEANPTCLLVTFQRAATSLDQATSGALRRYGNQEEIKKSARFPPVFQMGYSIPNALTTPLEHILRHWDYNTFLHLHTSCLPTRDKNGVQREELIMVLVHNYSGTVRQREMTQMTLCSDFVLKM